ncbi:acyl dehydratase [Azomonas agilis]|uniref:Acyl dehydratase n=2 Tax=Azomonas agilis TaxID=116849 RepID=A0A562J1G5_9GAMM|nr:acyl dehydratase [Azomonas agilis]
MTMTTINNIPYDALEPGMKAQYSKTIEERDLILFAEVSGDHNPLHLDPEFAAKTIFKGRIAHGMLSGSLISAAIACKLPGPGSIYLGQSLTFTHPARIGDTLTVELEVLEKLPKFTVRIATRVLNQSGTVLVEGEAQVMAPRKQQEVELSPLPPIQIG